METDSQNKWHFQGLLNSFYFIYHDFVTFIVPDDHAVCFSKLGNAPLQLAAS